MKHTRVLGACLLATSTLLAACSDDDDDITGTGSNATVRFVNTTGGSFDVGSGGQFASANSNIGYGAGTSCLSVDASTPNLTLRQSGSNTSIGGFTPNFQRGGAYTVVVGGTPANPTFTQFRDTYAGANATTGGLRAINATGSATTYNLYYGPNGTFPTTATQSGFGNGTATSFFPSAAGNYNVRLTSGTGTTQTTVYDSPSFQLTGNQYQSVVFAPPASGSSTPRSFNVAGCNANG